MPHSLIHKSWWEEKLLKEKSPSNRATEHGLRLKWEVCITTFPLHLFAVVIQISSQSLHLCKLWWHFYKMAGTHWNIAPHTTDILLPLLEVSNSLLQQSAHRGRVDPCTEISNLDILPIPCAFNREAWSWMSREKSAHRNPQNSFALRDSYWGSGFLYRMWMNHPTGGSRMNKMSNIWPIKVRFRSHIAFIERHFPSCSE